MRWPLSVLALGALMMVAFVAFGQYAPQAHSEFYQRFGIVPARFVSGDQTLAEAGAALFGHVFVHYGFLHLLMNGLAFLQAAPFVALRIGDLRFLALFFVSALGGALAFI